MNKEFVTITDFEKYFLYEDGVVVNKKTGKVLSVYINNKGRELVKLYKNGKGYWKLVNQLVAQEFLSIPEEYKDVPVEELEVHHKDGNPHNNHKSNLMYVTHSDHMKLHRGETRTQPINNASSMKIYQYALSGEFIQEWPSQSEIERVLGFPQSNISNCIIGRYDSAYGYQWSSIKVDRLPPVKPPRDRTTEKQSKAVLKFTLDGVLIAEYSSVQEAARQTKCAASGICKCCNGKIPKYKGFIWKYKNPPALPMGCFCGLS